jgi:predicted ATP-binding protein involved in virulence
MTNTKIPLAIQSITLKNVGPFGDKGLTINFGEKKNPDKANIHILVGKNGSGKSTVLKGLFYSLAKGSHNFLSSNSDFYFKGMDKGVKITATGVLKLLNYFYYTPNEPMIKQSEYNYLPKNRDDGNNISQNWVCYYPEKDYLEYIRKIENDRSEILANPSQQGERKLTIQQISFLESKIRIIEKLESFVKDIYGIDFLYKRNSNLEWQPYVDGKFIDFNQLSLGYKQIISLITDILIKIWNENSNLSNREEASFVLLLDEIDAHLHPEAQRKILPAIQKLFPNAEIFCTTHSPFVVTSASEAWIYEIKDGRLEDRRLTNAGDSYRYSLLEDFDSNSDFSSEVDVQLKVFIDLLFKYESSKDMNIKLEIENLAKKLMKYGIEVQQIVIFNLKKYGLYN